MSYALVDEICAKLSSGGLGSLSSSATTYRLVARAWLAGTIGGTTQAQQIAVFPTGGLPREPEEDLDRPTFQLLFRGTSGSSTGLETDIDTAIRILTTSPNGFTVLGRRYASIDTRGNMLYLGRDQNNRPMYSQNFIAWRSRTT